MCACAEAFYRRVNFEGAEYTVRVANTFEEAYELAKAGFEKRDEFDGKKIYQKRK